VIFLSTATYLPSSQADGSLVPYHNGPASRSHPASRAASKERIVLSELKTIRGPRLRRGAAWLAMPAAVAAISLLAACSSGSSGSSSSASSPSAATTGQAAAGGGTTVTATETEFHIALSTMTFHPGTYKFVAVNKGQASHNLVISGPGVNQVKTPGLISPGAQEPVTVTLQQGSYDVYCGVPGHKAMGMDVHITVS
jgi:plastocyanin